MREALVSCADEKLVTGLQGNPSALISLSADSVFSFTLTLVTDTDTDTDTTENLQTDVTTPANTQHWPYLQIHLVSQDDTNFEMVFLWINNKLVSLAFKMGSKTGF